MGASPCPVPAACGSGIPRARHGRGRCIDRQKIQSAAEPAHLAPGPTHHGLRVGPRGRQLDPDALEVHRVGHRRALCAQPGAQRVALPRRRQPREAGEVERGRDRQLTGDRGRRGVREVGLRELGEQRTRLTEPRGAARRDLGRRRPARAQQRGDPPTQVVTVETLVAVAPVAHDRQAPSRHERLEFGARGAEQRPQHPPRSEPHDGRHGGEAVDAGAAHQHQQHRLQLVVEMMGGEQRLPGTQRRGERGAAGTPRLGLERQTLAAAHLDPPHGDRHAERMSEIAAPARPSRGHRLQAVVDVQRPQRQRAPTRRGAAQGDQRREQRHRIGSAAQGDAETGGGRLAQQFREPGTERGDERIAPAQLLSSLNTPNPAMRSRRAARSRSAGRARSSVR